MPTDIARTEPIVAKIDSNPVHFAGGIPPLNTTRSKHSNSYAFIFCASAAQGTYTIGIGDTRHASIKPRIESDVSLSSPHPLSPSYPI